MEGVVMEGLFDFFRGKRVMVTGHTGFKGSWLSFWLHLLGARVSGLSLLPEEPARSLFESLGVGSFASCHEGDIRDLGVVRRVCEAEEPEVVLHLAAQSLVRRSYRSPVETYLTNVIGTVHLLEAVRTTPSVRSVVVVTSDKCYENREWVWGYREQDHLGGRDPYSSSKACAELATAAYRDSFLRDAGVAAASCRAGNVIGGGDWAEDRLVPDIIRAAASGAAVTIRNPAATRPWQHLLDPLHGYMMVARALWAHGSAYAEAWNFGPDSSSVTVEEIARAVIEQWGSGTLQVEQDAAAPPEAHSLQLDSSKARRRLGWRPVIPLPEALRMTVDWYRTCLADPQAAQGVAERQIRSFMERTQ